MPRKKSSGHAASVSRVIVTRWTALACPSQSNTSFSASNTNTTAARLEMPKAAMRNTGSLGGSNPSNLSIIPL